MPSRVLVVDDSATIRRVVGAILERSGYEVVLAADGQAALDVLGAPTGHAVDLVLLDFVMPRMNGYQFCRAVRQNDDLAVLPVVLMSAKSDKIRDQFVQQTGAIDAISKPFDAQALVAVIENALRRVQSGRASAARISELLEDEPPSERVPLSQDPAFLAKKRHEEAAAKVARALAPAFGAQRAALETAVRQAAPRIEPGALAVVAEALRELDDGRPALSGDLAVIPIGAVLQLLQVEGQSGQLVVSDHSREIALSLRGGLIDLVQSRGTTDEFRIGRYFVEEGLVTPQELEGLLSRTPANDAAPPRSGPQATSSSHEVEALSVAIPLTAQKDPPTVRFDRDAPEPPTIRLERGAAEELIRQAEEQSGAVATETTTDPEGFPAAMPQLLGDRLLAAGRINEAQLRAALVRQSSELVYEMLRWPKGHFEFRRRPPHAQATAAKLGLTVPAVVMEGFRRVDEWRGLETTLGSFDGVLLRDDLAIGQLPPEKLPKVERAVLDAVDGHRTVREVVSASHMSSFDACRVIVQLLEARLVRRKA